MRILDFPFILIFVAAGVLIIIILIVFILYRKKSRENDRVMKHMQNQMDTLEAKVAKECKEGMFSLNVWYLIVGSLYAKTSVHLSHHCS